MKKLGFAVFSVILIGALLACATSPPPAAFTREMGVTTQQATDAQIALAQGHNALEAGTNVVALSHFIKAVLLDPTLAEAFNRQTILAANISTGSMSDATGANIGSDIDWRNRWAGHLNEVRDLFIAHTDNFPFYIVYSTDIEHTGTDFNKIGRAHV